MQLENRFTVAAPIEEAWAALNDPETVAPCFPGATLAEYAADAFTGIVKVKLGPISMTYKGKGTYVSRDEANRTVVIEAAGRDSRGNGTAAARVTGTMVAAGPDKTEVTMVTDMKITGRPAQFSRGVISDVADRIIGQFSSCLADMLTGSEVSPPAVAPANGTAVTSASLPAAGVQRPAAAEAIDLLDSAGIPVLRRLAPIAAALAVLAALAVVVLRGARSS